MFQMIRLARLLCGPADPDQGGAGGGIDNGAETATFTAAEVDAKINAAITAREKRFAQTVEKMVNDGIGRVLATQPKVEQKAEEPKSEGTQQKPDPALVLLTERQKKLEEQLATSERTRVEIEAKAQKDAARRSLTEALAAQKITGIKARAIVADLEASGAFKIDENGKAILTIARARAKGAQPQELDFDNIAQGVADWAQTEEAKEFLPAPTPLRGATQNAGFRPSPFAGAKTGQPIVASENEDEAAAMAAAILEKQ